MKSRPSPGTGSRARCGRISGWGWWQANASGRLRHRSAIAMAGVLALVVTGFVLERPRPSVMSAQVPMLESTADGIQKRAGDQGFALMHAGASGVIYTVGTQGTMGARYVDPKTEYVTMTKVYVE